MSENVVYPIVPNGFADHYPVFKMAISLGILTQHFQTNPLVVFFWGDVLKPPKGLYCFTIVFEWDWTFCWLAF